MKYAINIIIKIIGDIYHLIYPIKLEIKLNHLLDKIYTQRISKEFKSTGEKIYIFRKIFLANPSKISIGSNVKIYSNTILAVHTETRNKDAFIEIGDNTIIGEFTHITSCNKIIIGKGVLTGRRVTITDNSHGKTTLEEMKIPPNKRALYSKGPVLIEDNVWIGDNVVILPNITIGTSSIIGASSVVNRNIPPYSIAVGNPIKIVKTNN